MAPSHNLPFKIELNKDCESLFTKLHLCIVDKDVQANYLSSLPIQGVVAPKSGFPVQVFVTCQGIPVGTKRFTDHRPDILAKFELEHVSYNPFFHIRINTLPLPRSFRIDLWVDIMTDGEVQRIRLCSICGTLNNIEPMTIRSRHSPILVSGIGRSGTSLLMSIFDAHRSILVPGKFPFEYRQATYLWHALKVITSPANHSDSMHPDGFDSDHTQSIGYNPYVDRAYDKAYSMHFVPTWQDECFPIELINFTKNAVDQFIDAASQDKGKPFRKMFAEKTNFSSINNLVLNIYDDARQIILIRDVRDSFVSARSFNKKRRTPSFGFNGKSDIDVLASRIHAVNLMMEAKNNQSPNIILVRYEDLVNDLHGTLKNLYANISMEYDDSDHRATLQYLESNTETSSNHKTSKDTHSSVGRWRKDMTDEEIAFSNEHFNEFLEAFGYPQR